MSEQEPSPKPGPHLFPKNRGERRKGRTAEDPRSRQPSSEQAAQPPADNEALNEATADSPEVGTSEQLPAYLAEAVKAAGGDEEKRRELTEALLTLRRQQQRVKENIGNFSSHDHDEAVVRAAQEEVDLANNKYAELVYQLSGGAEPDSELGQNVREAVAAFAASEQGVQSNPTAESKASSDRLSKGKGSDKGGAPNPGGTDSDPDATTPVGNAKPTPPPWRPAPPKGKAAPPTPPPPPTTPPVPPTAPPAAPRSPERGPKTLEEEALIEELADKKEELASLNARRQRQISAHPDDKAAHEQLRREYDDLLIEVGMIQESLKDRSRTPEQKRRDVLTYLLEQENELRRMAVDKLQGTKFGKVAKWMTEGSFIKKMAKGGMLSVTGGLGAALLTGGMAIPVAVSVGAGVMTTDYLRRNAGRGMDVSAGKLATLHNEATASRSDALSEDDRVKAFVRHMGERFEEATEDQQLRRRKAFGRAALTGVVAGVVSFGVAVGIDAYNNPVDAAPGHDGEGSGSGGSEGSDRSPDDTPGDGENHTDDPEILNGSEGGTEFDPQDVEGFMSWLDGQEVRPWAEGYEQSSVWGFSEQYLIDNGISNPTDAQIDAVTDQMLPELQELGFADENGWLTAGDTFNTDINGGAESGAEHSDYDASDTTGEEDATADTEAQTGADSQTPPVDADAAPQPDSGTDRVENTDPGELSPEGALAAEGISIENGNILLEEEMTVRELARALEDYYDWDIAPAELADAFTDLLGNGEYSTSDSLSPGVISSTEGGNFINEIYNHSKIGEGVSV